jgi:ATPase family protein associated with various cellular activities (AAA)
MFLESLSKLKSSYFVDDASTTKSELIDCLFLNNPKYLLIDEIDKMSVKDQAMLLNLIETGIVSKTKHNKTRKAHMKTSVFATSNNVGDIITPLQSRFFVVELPPYTYEQFYQISVHILTKGHKVSHDSIDSYKSDPQTFPNFQLISSDMNTVLAGHSAYTLVGTYYDLDHGTQKVLETGTVIDDKGYYIRYIADEPKYSALLPTVKNMINSFEISKP